MKISLKVNYIRKTYDPGPLSDFSDEGQGRASKFCARFVRKLIEAQIYFWTRLILAPPPLEKSCIRP